MLRVQQRHLREYLVKRKYEDENKALKDDKKRLKASLDENKAIPIHLRKDIKMRKGLNLESSETLDERRDDEYRNAGSYVPRILITTSSSPSTPCLRFAKELKLVVPNSERINRGQLSEKELVDLCKRDDVTDLIEISGADGEGRPTMMKVCHFPFGPTALFTLTDITMRADLPVKPPHMSQQNPHLIFHRFETKIGERIMDILRFLFPVTNEKSSRVLTFGNIGEKIMFRHHVWESNSTLRKFHQNDRALDEMTQDQKDNLAQRIELKEVGPRFTLIPYSIVRGTVDNLKTADSEWTKSAFIRKAKAVLA